MKRKRVYFYIILCLFCVCLPLKALCQESKSFDNYFIKEKEIEISTGGRNIGSLREIRIGMDDKILFLDAKGGQLLVFDQSGTCVKKIGSSGQGPGEYIVPLAVCTDADGHVYIADSGMRRINAYDQDGKFLKSFIFSVIHSQPATIRVDSNKNVIMAAMTIPIERTEKRYWLNKYDKNGKYLKSFFENNSPGDWVSSMYPHFTFDINKDVIYVMQINRYEISLFSSNGTLIKTMAFPPDYYIKPDEKYVLDERKFKSQEALKKELIRLSESWTRIVRLDVVDDRRLLVVTATNGLVKDCRQKYIVDLWSTTGELIASRISTNYTYLCSDKKGCAYFLIRSDEETALDKDPSYVIGKYHLLSPGK